MKDFSEKTIGLDFGRIIGPDIFHSQVFLSTLIKRTEAMVIVKLFHQAHGTALIVVMQSVLLKNVTSIICSMEIILFRLMEVK